MIDVTNNNAFSVRTLTDAILKTPYKPSRLAALNIFQERGIPTTHAVVEIKDGWLKLLPTRDRKEPLTYAGTKRRSIKTFEVPHIPVTSPIWADDIQNVRVFGADDNQLVTMAAAVTERQLDLRQSLEYTIEYHRVGAIQGVVLDADGATVVTNIFEEFDVTEKEVDFAFATGTSDIRGKCLEVKRYIEKNLGGGPAPDYISGFCGETFFNELIKHPTVKTAYELWQQGEALRNDPRPGFVFAGIRFEEYPGINTAGVDYIPTTDCRFVPIGVPGLFKTYFAPANWIQTANTIGLAAYSQVTPMQSNRGVDVEAQSNPLNLCLKPDVLVKGVVAGD